MGSTGTRKTDVRLTWVLGSRCLVLVIEQQELLTTELPLQPPDECLPSYCVVFGLLFEGRILLGCRTKGFREEHYGNACLECQVA